ncbi:uncharacterized protein LOC121616560 [Chelmon rostratus]|uniref:uncharacterized protein LOC121616560 n=1 Tax=Chelmon rostratus TaxID=109905 RepID=UPI001BEA035F|nr:uncharacterized protein LOC121616560 [Chelmon rostratus]
MFHLVSFLQTNEVAVVPDLWVNGGQCAWPKLKGEHFTKAVKTKLQPQKEWKKYRIRILYTAEKYDDARKKLPEAELYSDIQSDTEVVKMPRRILKNRRFQDYDHGTDSEDDGHTVRGLVPPPVLKPPQPAVVAQDIQHSSSYHAAKEPLTAFSQESYQQSLFSHPASQPSTDHSSGSYQQTSLCSHHFSSSLISLSTHQKITSSHRCAPLPVDHLPSTHQKISSSQPASHLHHAHREVYSSLRHFTHQEDSCQKYTSAQFSLQQCKQRVITQ